MKRIFECKKCGEEFVSQGHPNPCFLADYVDNCPECGSKCWELEQ